MRVAIQQDDLMMGILTVRENLQFSAALRLTGMTRKQRKERVEKVIRRLELQSCADTKVRIFKNLQCLFYVYCYLPGGHRVNSRGVRRGEEENQYWYGADYWASCFVLGWAHHWSGCSYSSLSDEAAAEVSTCTYLPSDLSHGVNVSWISLD